MSFNKRYINKNNIDNIRKDGLDALIRYIESSDCIIMQDNYSKMVHNIILEFCLNENPNLVYEKLKDFFDGYEC